MDSHPQTRETHTISDLTPRVLNFFILLKQLINKEIYVMCIEGPAVVQGLLIEADYNHIILLNQRGTHNIARKNIEGISVSKSNDVFIEIENAMPSNEESSFFNMLNKRIIALSKRTPWGHCGILTYIGRDYITVFNDEDSEYAHIPISEIKDMATNWSDLKI